jgi:hypothetical protein
MSYAPSAAEVREHVRLQVAIASRSWRDIEAQLKAYEQRKWQPAAFALGSIALMLVVAMATNNVGLALLPVLVGVSIAMILSGTIGVQCLACQKVMNDIGARGASPLMLLVNLKQCPLCQNKFDDAA